MLLQLGTDDLHSTNHINSITRVNLSKWSTIVCLRRTTHMELITSATQRLQSFAKRVQNKTKDTFLSMIDWSLMALSAQ